ncbi:MULTISPECIES: LrgB family protein [Microbulbifer]|uniref:LrgB family protein n=1 Tax=Microbulbifer TaxID=48073 RepID=UPI001E5C9320|nr:MULTISPECIES: LrgB family protein [Microbulbifer]UHQ53878.1 LrgB family protein [Microbulbifer sp. YPW16]
MPDSLPALLGHPLFILPLNVAGFLGGLWLYRRSGTTLLHPIVGASLLVAGSLYALGIEYRDYQSASGALYALLGPAVVALAVPLRQNLAIIRRAAMPLTVTLCVGAVLAPLIGVGLALLLGASGPVLAALSGKAVTTPIALAIAGKVGAAESLTVGIVVFSGVVGAVLGPSLMRRLGAGDPRIVGFVLGINAHAIGTARALEISALCGAFAALAMGLCGALTAVFLPLLAGA